MIGALTPNDSAWVAEIMSQAANEALQAETDRRSYAMMLKPRLSIDGNMWCALFGEDLQNGVAGFGESPYLAYQDFDHNWCKKLRVTP